MSRINSARLTEIFKSISQVNSTTKLSKTSHSPVSVKTKSLSKRDENELKVKLKKRLLELQKQPEEFIQFAELITIQEIICWEFGEQVLNHHEFKKISMKVTQRIKDSQELSNYMSSMIDKIIED